MKITVQIQINDPVDNSTEIAKILANMSFSEFMRGYNDGLISNIEIISFSFQRKES